MYAAFNAPHTPNGVVIEETDRPGQTEHQVLVRVGASSLNRGELVLMGRRDAGWRPGQDVAGVVETAAADGTGPAVGERVVGRVEGAGWAEYVAVDTDRLAVLPDQVGLDGAATLPIAGLTALRTLRRGGNLLGRRVVLTGASGAVGRLQVQLAAASGAYVTAVAAAAHGQDLVRLGAHEVVEHVGDGGGAYDLVVESVGGQSLADAIAATAPGATVVTIGATSGERTAIWQNDFFGHENVAIRPYMSYASDEPDDADLGVLVGMLGSGRLDPQIAMRVPWHRLHEGVTALRERTVHGKVVLTFG